MRSTGSQCLVAMFFAVSSCAAFGQSSNPFIGKWKVTWQGEKRTGEAALVIEETGGSWQTFAKSRRDNCVGLKVPIAVESSSGNAMTIKLKFSVLQGCSDSTVELKRVDDKTVSGTRGSADLVLTRE